MGLIRSLRTGWGIAFGLALVVALAAVRTSARADDAKPSPGSAAKASGESDAAILAEAWPDRPEWLDMYTDILQGSQLGPNDGWFRRAVAQTRFDWASTRKRYDRNGDGRVSREEFFGSDADFARLDRDEDKAVTEADFDFSAHALTPSVGSLLFRNTDCDGNGKLTREEVDAFFRRMDSGGMNFLSLSDVQQAFDSPRSSAATAKRAGDPAAPKSTSGPSKETLIRGLFRQEIGSLQAGPTLGEPVTDFTLKAFDGLKEITLSKLIGSKPVVLVFGNFTCGPFRMQAGNVEKLYRRYSDRATFVMVYVREAHPIDGWRMESNDAVGVQLSQPQTYEERVSVARTCGERLALGFPMLVDTMDDQVGARYSGMPSRLYLIDGAGKVAYKSGRGPFGFKPAELEQSLILLLQEGRSTTTSRAINTSDGLRNAGEGQ